VAAAAAAAVHKPEGSAPSKGKPRGKGVGKGGGVTQLNKVCAFPGGCTTKARVPTEFCKKHGGGARCTFPGGCPKAARDASGLCAKHGGGEYHPSAMPDWRGWRHAML
jgi:hypothetical protein